MRLVFCRFFLSVPWFYSFFRLGVLKIIELQNDTVAISCKIYVFSMKCFFNSSWHNPFRFQKHLKKHSKISVYWKLKYFVAYVADDWPSTRHLCLLLMMSSLSSSFQFKFSFRNENPFYTPHDDRILVCPSTKKSRLPVIYLWTMKHCQHHHHQHWNVFVPTGTMCWKS